MIYGTSFLCHCIPSYKLNYDPGFWPTHIMLRNRKSVTSVVLFAVVEFVDINRCRTLPVVSVGDFRHAGYNKSAASTAMLRRNVAGLTRFQLC